MHATIFCQPLLLTLKQLACFKFGERGETRHGLPMAHLEKCVVSFWALKAEPWLVPEGRQVPGLQSPGQAPAAPAPVPGLVGTLRFRNHRRMSTKFKRQIPVQARISVHTNNRGWRTSLQAGCWKAEVSKRSSAQGNNFPMTGFQRAYGTIQAGRALRRSPSQPPAQSRVSCDQVAQSFIQPGLENLQG